MATFRTYAEVLRPDHPLMKNKARNTSWSSSRYRSADIEQAMRAEPGVVLGDVLRQTGGAYETTTRLTPKFREDIREIAELTSDDELQDRGASRSTGVAGASSSYGSANPHTGRLSARCQSGRESTAAPKANTSA